jgi:hypothetical protein
MTSLEGVSQHCRMRADLRIVLAPHGSEIPLVASANGTKTVRFSGVAAARRGCYQYSRPGCRRRTCPEGAGARWRAPDQVR